MKSLIDFFNVNALTIDLLLFFVIIYNVIKSAKQGLIGSLISFLLLILSYVLVWPLSKMASDYIYNENVKQEVRQVINNKLLEKGIFNLDSISGIFNSMVGAEDYLTGNLQNIDSTEYCKIISNMISDKLIYPFINIIMSIIIMSVFSFVFSIVVKFVSKLFKCFSYVPVLGKFNMILGGVFGFCRAMVIMAFIALIINGLILISGNELSFLNEEVKNETYILKRCDVLIKNKKFLNLTDEIKNIIFDKNYIKNNSN